MTLRVVAYGLFYRRKLKFPVTFPKMGMMEQKNQEYIWEKKIKIQLLKYIKEDKV